MIRAGFGEFRRLYRADALASADGATGLAGALRRITCVGASAPEPVFDDTGVVPTACAAGSPSLADAAPSVSVPGKRYQPPRN